MATDYSKKTVADLQEILKSRSLAHSGKKAELITRLQEDDSAKAKAPAGRTDAADDVIDWDDDAPAVEEAVQPSTEAGAAAIAAGGKGEVANPVAVPNQELAVDPAKTDDLKVESEGNAAKAVAKAAVAGGTEDGKSAEKPAVDYSIGLPTTELEEELKKRKARAEKFGIVEDDKTALEEAEKAIQRAKRFGTDTGGSGAGVKGLDQALPNERPRKRGRGDDHGGQGGRGGKRRDFGRNNRNSRPNNRNRNGKGGGSGGVNNNSKPKPVFSDKDAAAAEARKKRFATTT